MAEGSGEEIRLGGLAIRFLVEGKDSGGSMAMFEFDVQPGAKVPVAHSHDGYEETIYGLEGVLTLTVAGRVVEVGRGDALCIRRGEVHRFDNLHAEASKSLAVISPGVLGPDFFREIRDVIKAGAGGPPDPKAIGEVMRRHGLTPVP